MTTSKLKSAKVLALIILIGGPIMFTMIFNGIINLLSKFSSSLKNKLDENRSKNIQKELFTKLQQIFDEDKKANNFNKQNYCEAFADNFARMYGYGPQLMSALQKMQKKFDTQNRSWYKRERDRQNYILAITIDMMSNEHKTELHRIKSLIDEYKADINDPNTPPQVKKMLENDVNELKIIVNKYLNDMSDFQNKINNMIIDNIDLIIDEDSEGPSESSIDEVQQESTENIFESISYREFENFYRANVDGQFKVYGHPFSMNIQEFKESGYMFNMHTDEYITESKKAYEKMKKEIDAVTSSERAYFNKKFKGNQCSIAKDKDGFYVRTHRARSKSYENIDKIPKKDVDFISSTS